MTSPDQQFPDLPLGIYRHYKGKDYRLLGIARHSETLEPHVIYQALYDDDEFGNAALWVRPYSLFIETVETEVGKVNRFELLKSEK